MNILSRFFKKNQTAPQKSHSSKIEEKAYIVDLGNKETLKSLIGFLSPEQCANVFQIQFNPTVRAKYLGVLDSNPTAKMGYLRAAKVCAAYKKHPAGYDVDKNYEDLDRTLAKLADSFGEEYDPLQPVQRVAYVDKVQKLVVPLLILDAMRQYPDKVLDITRALHMKGKRVMRAPQKGSRSA